MAQLKSTWENGLLMVGWSQSKMDLRLSQNPWGQVTVPDSELVEGVGGKCTS